MFNQSIGGKQTLPRPGNPPFSKKNTRNPALGVSPQGRPHFRCDQTPDGGNTAAVDVHFRLHSHRSAYSMRSHQTKFMAARRTKMNQCQVFPKQPVRVHLLDGAEPWPEITGSHVHADPDAQVPG